MVHRTSVIGIDGAGKDTAISSVTSSLSLNNKIVKLGRPTYVEENKTRTYLFENTLGLFDRMHSTFDGFKLKAGVLLINSVSVSLLSGMERGIIDKYSPDIIVSGRDITICPTVYVTYYFPPSRKISTELRLRMFSSLRKLGYPDEIVYLDVNPELAESRITKRIAAGEFGNDRASKWRHMHENSNDLSELRKYYLEAIDILSNNGIRIFTVDTNNISKSEVAKRIERIIVNDLGPTQSGVSSILRS